jgi:prepilin-type N-terminal cleavage/methylation domain-containing protein
MNGTRAIQSGGAASRRQSTARRHWGVAQERARGFSMVELLMAVLILGLGLLGLGAIMPVVVRQQQIGADQTQGTTAARAGRGFVVGNAQVDAGFWSRWARTLPDNTPTSIEGGQQARDDRWRNLLPENGDWFIPTIDVDTNRIFIGRQGGQENAGQGIFRREFAVPIAMNDRLFPSASAALGQPQFVWDVAFRRMGRRNLTTTPVLQERGYDRVQMALIVRRVDGFVRTEKPAPNAPESARDPLFVAFGDPTLAQARRRWPVARDTSTGLPTLDGRFDGIESYAHPLVVPVRFEIGPAGERDRLVLEPSGISSFGVTYDGDALAAQLITSGQTFIDNLGNVYSVLGADTRVATQYAVRISPPVPPGVAVTDNNNPASLRTVLVTPQSPASVLVEVLNP